MTRYILILTTIFLILFIAYIISDRTTQPRFIGGPVAVYEGSMPTHGYLGINFTPEADDLKVIEVYAESAGFKAGIQPGDRILLVDGNAVTSRKDFYTYMRRTEPHQTLDLGVLRKGEQINLTATLGSFADFVQELNPLPINSVDQVLESQP